MTPVPIIESPLKLASYSSTNVNIPKLNMQKRLFVVPNEP